MEINGTQVIPAARTAVWNALNDTVILKACLPGCESVEQTGEGSFRVIVAMAIGPLRARFNGTLRMTEANPPQSCVMVFEGQGGAVGFGKGTTTVALNESSGNTELTYSAQAQIGGKLAQVGSRLIDNVAKKMSDDFFNAFRLQLAPRETNDSAAASPASVASSQAEPRRNGNVAQAATTAQVASGNNHAGGAKPATVTPQAAASRDTTAAMPQPAIPATASAASAASAAHDRFLVPGWWLGVAMLLGVFASFAGAHWMR
ncbi:CoxG family protein [Paraburkholderia sp. ZP32-5]|uniref:CoxG family protein n=1 Tax=Paraburkholderia sp. ZP32-5 TaxID=2883245 RepID=UPI001F2B0884|nr:carbon monoxide dehydrogenase subunit G [Paraburkholderia sp. ZP32-5]